MDQKEKNNNSREINTNEIIENIIISEAYEDNNHLKAQRKKDNSFSLNFPKLTEKS